MPHSVEQFVCPVTAERLYRELAVWDEVGYGLDFAPAKAMSLNNIYVRWLEPGDLLEGGAAAQGVGQGNVRRPQQDDAGGRGQLAREPAGHRHRPGAVVAAELVPGVGLATGPLDPRTHWEQLYLPALSPIALKAGQTLSARLRSTTSFDKGTNVTWTLAVKDASGREVLRQALDLEKGYLP